jgi:hypothetical protein
MIQLEMLDHGLAFIPDLTFDLVEIHGIQRVQIALK